MKVIQSHPENPIAYIVYDLLEDSKIDKNTDLSALFSNFSKEGRKTELKENKEYTKRSRTIYDYRFRNLQMRNFRKFPHDEKRNYPYGIDFLMEKGPASLILVGSNGTGKTSLFSAMEYTMTRFLSSANLRNIPEKEYPHYLAYSNQRFENVQVVLDTEKETIYSDTLNPELANYDFLKCFFCSERDLVEMGRQESLLEYIIGQVGYGEYLELKKVVEEIYKEYQEKEDSVDRIKDELLRKKEEEIDAVNERKVVDVVSSEELRLYQMSHEKSFSKNKNESVIKYQKNYKDAIQKIKENNLEFELSEIKEFGDGEEVDTAETLNNKKLWIEAYERMAERCIVNFKECIQSMPFESDLRDWLQKEVSNLESLKISNKDNFIDQYNDRLRRYRRCNFKKLEWLKRKAFNDVFEFLKTLPTLDAFECLKNIVLYKDQANEKVSNLNHQIAEMQKYVDKVAEKKAILNSLELFVNALQNEYNTQLRFLELLYKNFVEVILNYFSVNGEKYTLSLTNSKLDILVEYEDIDHQVVQKTPREYLNSFRFKLFNMSVKVAMAMAAMRINKIAHPIVFDDVFYSSDFENRGRVEEFIRRLFEAYKDNVKPHIDNKNLQVVFLTHDDIIMDAIREGIQSLEYTVPVQYGRLFDYREMNRPKDLESYIYAKTQPPLNPATKTEKNRYIRLYINLQ